MTNALFRCATLCTALLTPAAWAAPEIKHWTADTEAQVYFVQSDALPMLDVRIDFAAGEAYAPEDQAGLASLVQGLIFTGADGLDEQALAEAIADTGAQINGGTEADRAWLTVRTLSSAEERDAAIKLAARMLAQPDYPEAAVQRELQRAAAALRESLTRPATLAERRIVELSFGDHPYGRNVSFDSLNAVSRETLVNFHHHHYTARNATVSLVGDVSQAEAERIANMLTRNLPAGEAPAPLPSPTLPAAHVERIPHPSSQAHILAGMPGIEREDPDYFALLLGNHILGGNGLVSRLSNEVRDQRGLAYSVYSYFAPRAVAGPFRIGLQTRGSQAETALDVMRDVLADFIHNGPTEEELEAARSNLINGFGLRLDSNAKILGYIAMIGFYGLPLDWLDTYTDHLETIDVATIRDAFSRRIKLENLAVVMVGGSGDEGANADEGAEKP